MTQQRPAQQKPQLSVQGLSQPERAVEAFRVVHDSVPTRVWSAPGRVNLIGDHTDYNNGLVLPFALDRRTAAAVAPREDHLLHVTTVGYDDRPHHGGTFDIRELTPASLQGWAAYPAGVAWAVREHEIPFTGATLVIAGDVPSGAGLSSSHALECAVALALLDLAGVASTVDRAELARWIQEAENGFVGASTGLLDQTASLNCITEHALFFDVRSGIMEQVPFTVDSHGLDLLVIDSRVHHSHRESGYGDRRKGCERAATALGIPALREIEPAGLDAALGELPEELHGLVRHVVTENERVQRVVELLRRDAITEIGPLLTASHVSLRDDFRVSVAALDVAVDAALAHGALGARMTGGGFGGSALALIPESAAETVTEAVTQAASQAQQPTPRIFSTRPAAGARRDA